ncbi:NAD(P)H-quinone oxidoreductase subunit 3 [Roseomonas gilardii subsp. rosea]|nr:NAD(P)H-quinone oxidoreductase subunit 3 [Roseomonas gilardii subsp. rosea]
MAVLLPARYGSVLRAAVCSRCIAHALVALFALDNETMTQPLLAEYFPILVFLAIAVVISIAMVGGSFLAAHQKPDPEKLSTYECGFEPFEDTRHRFDVRFYLVAILFIIFDLEVAFLFPWAISLGTLGWVGFLSMMGFLTVLTVGFVYEWRKGALDWE